MPSPGDPEQEQQHPDRAVVPRRDSQEEHQRKTEQQQVLPVRPADGEAEQEERQELQRPPHGLVLGHVLAVAALVGLHLEPAGKVEAQGVLHAQPLAPEGVLGAVMGHVAQEVTPGRDPPTGRHRARDEQQGGGQQRSHPQPEELPIHLSAGDQPPHPQHHRAGQQEHREHPDHGRVADQQTRPQGPPEPPAGQPCPSCREPVVDEYLTVDPAGVPEPRGEREQHQQTASPAPGPHAQGERGQQEQRVEQHEQRLLPRHLDVQQPGHAAAHGVPGRRRVVPPVDDDVGPEDRLAPLREPAHVGLELLPAGIRPGRQTRQVPVEVRLLPLVGLQVADQLGLSQVVLGLLVRDQDLRVEVVVAELLEVPRADPVVEGPPELHLL